jgi:hypothetical protein
MEEVETFFKSQREIYDAAWSLKNSLQDEMDYFATGQEISTKIEELSSILDMPKPYGKIKDLSELMQGIKADYGILLWKKREEVHGIIAQSMDEIHTVAGRHTEARMESNKADKRFTEYKQEVDDSKSLISLDAKIQQIQRYAVQVRKQIDALLKGGSEEKVVSLRCIDVIAPRKLLSREDIDTYVEGIRKNLYEALADNDGIQIN